jgi:hypothetical protein
VVERVSRVLHNITENRPEAQRWRPPDPYADTCSRALRSNSGSSEYGSLAKNSSISRRRVCMCSDARPSFARGLSNEAAGMLAAPSVADDDSASGGQTR